MTGQTRGAASRRGQAVQYPFRFTRGYRLAGLPFRVTPGTAHLELDPDELRVRFGPWRLHTPRSNVAGAERTGGFAFLRTAGPPHLSLADRGVTFATNPDQAVCLRFVEPVRALDPTGWLRHPGATVTVADCDRLLSDLGYR